MVREKRELLSLQQTGLVWGPGAESAEQGPRPEPWTPNRTRIRDVSLYLNPMTPATTVYSLMCGVTFSRRWHNLLFWLWISTHPWECYLCLFLKHTQKGKGLRSADSPFIVWIKWETKEVTKEVKSLSHITIQTIWIGRCQKKQPNSIVRTHSCCLHPLSLYFQGQTRCFPFSLEFELLSSSSWQDSSGCSTSECGLQDCHFNISTCAQNQNFFFSVSHQGKGKE